jgi:hypothetical protein
MWLDLFPPGCLPLDVALPRLRSGFALDAKIAAPYHRFLDFADY